MKYRPLNISKISDRSTLGVEPGLFSGMRLKYTALNQPEKVVCGLIVLAPLWWLWGWTYLFIIFAAGVFAYEWRSTGTIALRSPSAIVVFGLCFGCCGMINSFFYLQLNGIAFGPRQILGLFESWIIPSMLLWYIQSKRLKIRLEPLAWAFSVLVGEMLLVLLIALVVFQQQEYQPLRSIFGWLTNKSTAYAHGMGNTNYLLPYFALDESFIPGLVRYIFFFPGPEALALMAGFIVLLALDLKNRTWSGTLFACAYFISLLSGTRSVLVSLFLVVILRYVLTAGKTFGLALVLTVMAAASFATFSLPPTSNFVFDGVKQVAQQVDSARADSTAGRSAIYRQTWQRIVNAPNRELFLGHIVPGESVTPYYKPAKIGTHSFYLSTLLYRSGIIGTLIFIGFWANVWWWFIRTRHTRPLCCLLVLVLFSLTFTVMELERPVMPLILLCSMLQQPNLSLTRRSR
ncbi:MAG: O-antigen ligase family protein [Cyanobacteria bacterium J06643_13]